MADEEEEKKKSVYDSCLCYDDGLCGKFGRFGIDGIFTAVDLNNNVKNHLVNLKVSQALVH